MMTLAAIYPSQAVIAADTPSQSALKDTYTLADFNYRTDINFQGVLVDHTFNITIPENWELTSDITLKIHFAHSSALQESSSMAVDWNQERLGSTLLKKSTADHSIFIVTIPAEKVLLGYNALQIEFYMGIMDDFCNDYDNPAVWAVVHNDTSLEFSHDIVAKDLNLRDVPNLLMDSSLLAENKVTLILPDQPDLAHLNALAVFGTKLGQLADWRKADVNFMTSSEAKKTKPDGNLVLFGTNDEVLAFNNDLGTGIANILDAYQSGSSSRTPIAEDDGLVMLQPSPFDDRYHVLTLSGQTSAAVEKSARGAAFETLFTQSTGTWTIVRTLPKSNMVGGQLSLTLEDLGYTDMTTYGTQEQTFQFNLPLSSTWSVDSEAWLDLHFNHSALLNRSRSTLSVLINSIPISSIALTPENAEDGYEEVLIPLRYLEIGNNSITLQANMSYTSNVTDMENYCTDNTNSRAWLTVHASSAIRFPDVSQQTPLNISSFPYGFADPYNFEGFAFALPESLGESGFNALTDLAFTLGKAMLGNPTDIQLVYTGNNQDSYNEFNYVVFLGKVRDLVAAGLNDNLPISFDVNSGQLEPNDTIMQVDNGVGHPAYMEAFATDQNTVMLALVGSDAQALMNAGEFLSQSGFGTATEGNVAVINSPDNGSVYLAGDFESAATITQADSRTTLATLAAGDQSIWVLRVAVGTLAISVIVLLIALFRKNKHGNES